jgi:hypothetical protein
VNKPARHQHAHQKTTETRHGGGSLRMPNVRGKALRHPDLAPAIAVDGSTLLHSDPLAANVNRSRRQVANSHRTPWRRP